MKNRTTVAICAIFALTLFITGINSVKATSAYDGSYNIVMSGMTVNPATNQVEEVHASSTYFGVEGFLIITNGHISNVYVESLYNPSLPPGVELVGPAWVTWDGTVDDQGNAQWTGGSFVANTGLSYTFIGKINSDGTGSGTWDRPGEAHGTWILTKTFVSNQNVGGVVGFFNQILAGIHQILGGIGVTGSNGSIGTTTIILLSIAVAGGIVVLEIRKIRKSRKAKKGYQPPKEVIQGRPQDKWTAEQAPQRSTQPEEFKAPKGGTPQGGTGLHVGPRLPEHPRLVRVLFDKFGNKVELDWTQPDFDADGMFGQYHLEGFEIDELLYNGLESPARILVDKLPSGATGWVHSFNQIYKFNSGGDIKGYVVNALVSYVDQAGNKVVLRLGTTAFSPVGGLGA